MDSQPEAPQAREEGSIGIDQAGPSGRVDKPTVALIIGQLNPEASNFGNRLS